MLDTFKGVENLGEDRTQSLGDRGDPITNNLENGS